MGEQRTINKTVLRLIKDDITDIAVEAFVYYATEDLALGSGYGGAISVRGGPTIQAELTTLAPIGATEAVITAAGEMKARQIIHAVGPKFQEENIEKKLRQTIVNALKLADEKGLRQLAFPAMGAGFYGVPLLDCAAIMLDTIDNYLSGTTGLEEVIVCLGDSRDYDVFAEYFAAAGKAREASNV